MSMFHQMELNAKKISSLLYELLTMDNEELYGKDRLHNLSFEQTGRESFKKVFNLLERLKKKFRFHLLPKLQSNFTKKNKDLLKYKIYFQLKKSII